MCALMMDSQNLISAVSRSVQCGVCCARPPVGVSSARSRSHVRFRWLLIGTKTYMHVFTVVWFLFVRSSTFAAGLFWIVLQFMFLPHLLRSGLRAGAVCVIPIVVDSFAADGHRMQQQQQQGQPNLRVPSLCCLLISGILDQFCFAPLVSLLD